LPLRLGHEQQDEEDRAGRGRRLAGELAEKLPEAVDKATPDGVIPSAEEVKQVFAAPFR
jgi:uncharacterized protein YidB (DUF937 family)